jgi:methylmalonyl-CoA mutase
LWEPINTGSRKEDPLEILEVDNSAVRETQIERLNEMKASRNEEECQAALDALTECARTGQGNLLELAIDAAAKRATLGEISYACEKIAGRYKAVIRTISGVYSSEYKADSDYDDAKSWQRNSPRKRGVSQGLWLQKWDRTATTAEPRWSRPDTPI